METKGNSEEINLQKYWQILKRRGLVASGVFAAFAGLAGLSWLGKPTYEATGKLIFQSNRTSSVTGVGGKIGDLESVVKREGNPLDTQALLLQSDAIKQEVINTLQLKDKKGAPLDPESIVIKTEAVAGTDVLKVSFASEDSKLATAVVNQVMKSYVENNIKTNRSEASAAGKFINNQLPWTEKELNQAAEALREFKVHNKIIELQQETGGTVQTINTLDNQLNNDRAQLADLTTQQKVVLRQLNIPQNKAIDIAALSQVSGIQGLLAELQKVQTQLATQRSRYTEANPSIITLEREEASLKSLLQERTSQALGYQANIAPGKLQMGQIKQDLSSVYVKLESQRLGLQKKIESLSKLKEFYQQRAKILPNLQKRQGELERRLLVAQKSYENLLTKQQEIKIIENQTVGNARVFENAKAQSSPAAMKKKLAITLGGGFSGLLLGVAAAFLVDLIDTTVKTAQEAEELFGYTLLGLIPKFATNNKSTVVNKSLEGVSPRVIVATSPRTVIHEAYQMLQANLKFISLDKKVRTIVVTSSLPGEGKTEVAANLAMVMAQAGRRVLLIDADMRQPSQHHVWGLINSVGLSNVMVGENEFSKEVQKVTTNLSVLTSGVMPPNPLALIDSERMTSFIEMLRQNYDYVVFDTPPLVGIADAAVLGNMVDGVLIVVRPSVLDSRSASAAKSLLARSEANILGIVANAVDIKQEPDNYFYYNSSRSEQSVEKINTVSSP
ncbi:MAG: polysaccharide biosynthesis tyrosine autokinase [Stigonema ocellatum SAG 48.90 = DSM 106950]|nr:polysaccharide biosynthesis tyrosine autokinase [Stigonema ocellatum SAG 48.90 = DSM 106950]